jgi:hypothetical protein
MEGKESKTLTEAALSDFAQRILTVEDRNHSPQDEVRVCPLGDIKALTSTGFKLRREAQVENVREFKFKDKK